MFSAEFDNYRVRFLAEKIYQIDYVNPYDSKRKSVLLHTKGQPEVTELLDIISARLLMPPGQNSRILLLA